MNRSLLSLAAAVAAATAFVAPAAQACISCEYTPEVVNTPVYGHYPRARVRAVIKVPRVRAYRDVAESARPSRKVAAQKVEAEKVEARVESKAETNETAETAPVALNIDSENSSISTPSLKKSEPVEKTASLEPETKPSVGCKKFFPTVGMTLTVPCE